MAEHTSVNPDVPPGSLENTEGGTPLQEPKEDAEDGSGRHESLPDIDEASSSELREMLPDSAEQLPSPVGGPPKTGRPRGSKNKTYQADGQNGIASRTRARAQTDITGINTIEIMPEYGQNYGFWMSAE